jgi:hypothetical protein
LTTWRTIRKNLSSKLLNGGQRRLDFMWVTHHGEHSQAGKSHVKRGAMHDCYCIVLCVGKGAVEWKSWLSPDHRRSALSEEGEGVEVVEFEEVGEEGVLLYSWVFQLAKRDGVLSC